VGLMEGLSHWLRQIIAVVLLAAIIDLILPNRTMQKYVRLVVGLFILMTVATPIINWMKGDFNLQLAESLNAIEQVPQRSVDELAMIENEGAKLRDRQGVQAAQLVAAKLERSIASEVEQSEQRAVREVDVQLQQATDGSLMVSKVMILLDAQQETTESSYGRTEVMDVKPIAAVDIRVDSVLLEQADLPVAAAKSEINPDDGAKEATDTATQFRVATLIANQFGISENIIFVNQPETVTTNSN
jgi:stage III sporulation protein AF